MVSKEYKFYKEKDKDFFTTEQLAIIFGSSKHDIGDRKTLGMFVNTPPQTRITRDTLYKVHDGLISVAEVVDMYKEGLFLDREDGCAEFPRGCGSNTCLSAGLVSSCPVSENSNKGNKGKYKFVGRIYFQSNAKKLYLMRHLESMRKLTESPSK